MSRTYLKRCCTCKIERPADEFTRSTGRVDGLSPRCRTCSRCVQYGITLTEFRRLMEKQNGRCAICGMADQSYDRLQIDHDHDTKKVRGLLCGLCNMMLRHAKDRPTVLRAAADYLEVCQNGAGVFPKQS